MSDLSTIIENTDFSGIMLILDRNFNVVRANDKFLNLLDYKEIDIFGKQLSDLLVADEKSIFFDMVYTQDISNSVTLKFYHKSGAFRFFSITILDFNDQKIVFGRVIKKEFLNNKYEYHKKIQTDLGKMFETIDVDNIRDFISFVGNPVSIILDLLPIEFWIKDRFGKYIFANQKFTLATNVKMEDIYLKDDFQVFDNETAKSFASSDHLAIDTGQKVSYTFETDNVTLGGWAEVTKIPVFNKYNKYIGILGFSSNITEQKLMEKNLLEETTRMKYLLGNVAGLVFEIDSNGKLIFVAGELSKKMGFDKFPSQNINMLDLHTNSNEISEKVRLALNGKQVELETNVKGMKIHIVMVPIRKTDGTLSIVGNGKEL